MRELALSMPTFFFQQVQTFFDVIFYAVRDSKPLIREGAVAALRSALVVTSQRETKEAQRPTWYWKGDLCCNDVNNIDSENCIFFLKVQAVF